MMPINILLEKVISQRVVDIEMIGAILEAQNWAIKVSSFISSDCGDHWLCDIFYKDGGRHISHIERFCPSLRTAIIEALERLIEVMRDDKELFNKEKK
jgi:hypothetical protein